MILLILLAGCLLFSTPGLATVGQGAGPADGPDPLLQPVDFGMQPTMPVSPLSAPNRNELDLARREASLIARVHELDASEELALYLGRSPGTQASQALSLRSRMRALTADPAIKRNFFKIEDQWFEGSLSSWGRAGEPLYDTVRELIQCKVMIARNLYFRGIRPSRESLQTEYLRIQRHRSRYDAIPVFSDRQVVYAASSDRTEGPLDKHLFGRSTTRSRIAQQAEAIQFHRPGDQAGQSNRETRRHLEDSLRPTSAHWTFLFEGHGRSSALKFAGSLSARDIATAMSLASSKSESPPIVVLDACKSHDFGRRLLAAVAAREGSTIPILIVPEEYGQLFVKGAFDDRFLKHDLQLNAHRSVDIGTVVRESHINASVYVPGDDDRPLQIS